MKARKKPVEIEYMCYDNPISQAEIARWCGGRVPLKEDYDDKVIVIPTLEGNMIALPNDYIIKGVKGEFYPCKPDIFMSTYDLIEEAPK